MCRIARTPILIACAVLCGIVTSARALPVLAPAFAGSYTITNLGSPVSLPLSYGGLTLKLGDPNTLLIGGNANTASGNIYSVGLTRNGSGHITGFSTSAAVFASAPNINAGLTYGPGNVLFATTFSNNNLLQYKLGSTTPDKATNLTPLGIPNSTGAVAFVPSGYTDAGAAWFSSFSDGKMYRADLVSDGSGTFNVTNVSQISTVATLLQSFGWVPNGSPVFSNSSKYVLTNNGLPNSVSAYTLNGSGFPDNTTAQNFITGFADPPVGMAFDPLTNDLLISQGGNSSTVWLVSGFTPVPEPSSMMLAGFLATGVFSMARRRRRKGA